MSIEGLFAVLVVTVVAGLLVAMPLRRKSKSGTKNSANERQFERLSVYYERILTNIRDLDEDYTTGKMNDFDYEMEREEWVQRGIQVLQALDQIGARPAVDSSQAAPAETEADIDDAIEAAIASYRKKSNP